MSMRSVVQKAAQCWSVAHAAEGFSFARYLSVSTQTFSGIPHSKDGYVTHPDLLNEAVKRTQYAVRGELYLRAMELQKEGMKIIFTNVGNPQQLGQKPITFIRQVISLCAAPFLLEHPEVEKMFPSDAIARAKQMLGYVGSIGAYSDSRGAAGIRQEIGNFIQKRDGVSVNPDHIFLTDGASVGVRMALNALIRGQHDSIMVPVPQYPLYSASVALYNGNFVGYELDESNGWSMDVADLQAKLDGAAAEGKRVRGLVFINPGNPTGQCLTRKSIEDLIEFAVTNEVVLMADEVYQPNIYQDEKPFLSARKVATEMGGKYASKLELASFHTVSKGAYGECGLRGGYFDLMNFHQGTVDELYKMASINLCPNIVGQLGIALMTNEPQPGDVSYDSWNAEKQGLLDSMRRKAHMMTDFFNSLDGVACTFTEGAMYSFPLITLPPKAVEAAAAAGKAQDVFYCLRLLEATGISTVPGTGFGQKAGTFHIRTTILPLEKDLPGILDSWQQFHESFMAEYK